MSVLVYLKAVGIYWYAVAGIILGAAAFLPYIPGWGRRLEEGVVTLLRRLAVILAVLILFVAQFLAWQDVDRQRAETDGRRADLERQLSGELERVARLEGRRDALEAELASVKGDARAERARVEGQRDLLSEQVAGERTRSDRLQDELRATERAARAQMGSEVWFSDDEVKLVSSRQLPHSEESRGGGLELALQTTRVRQPFGIEIECDCEFSAASIVPGPWQIGGPATTSSVLRDDKRGARLILYEPAFTPYGAVLVRVYSRERVALTRVEVMPLASIPPGN